ncbi:MAG: hypothetical protein HQ519_15865 [Planctomycetes bacterium]|nr:hypothetical protein [Planctomycetota bacterium]
MSKNSITVFLGLILVVAFAASGFSNRGYAPDAGRSFAKLVVTVSGPKDDWSNYGWLWDEGERRNGVPWIVSAGTLADDPSKRQSKGSNKSIYWWITDTAWPMKVGPTEIEILNAIGEKGWRMVESKSGANHSYISSEMEWDSAVTYYFQR